MKTKILTLLTLFALLVPSAMAVNPIPVVYNAADFTGFSVSGPAQMTFNGTKGTDDINPVEGNPWGNITNTGTFALTFNASLDVNNPDGIVLRLSNSTDMAEPITLTTAPGTPTGWNNVTGGGTIVDINAKANFSLSAPSTTARNITVGAT